MIDGAPRGGTRSGNASRTERPSVARGAQRKRKPTPRKRPTSRTTGKTSTTQARRTAGNPASPDRSAASYSRDSYVLRTASNKRKPLGSIPLPGIIVAAVLFFGIGLLIHQAVTASSDSAADTIAPSAVTDGGAQGDAEQQSVAKSGYNWASLQSPTSLVVRNITRDADLSYNYDTEEFNFYNGPLHLYRSGQPGGTFQEIDNASGNPVGQPIQQNAQSGAFGSYYPDFTDSGKKYVAFTFDDGPSPEWTPAILKILEENDVKATFFMLGSQAEKYPETAKMVVDAGHQIASHAYDHDADKYLNVCDTETVRWQLKSAQDAIYAATGQRPMVVRPPGGNMDWDNVIACEGYASAFVGWSIGTGDFDKPGVDYICNAVKEPLFSGGIVLMHDGGGDRSQTAEAVARLIPELKQQGYEFVTVDQIIEMENDKIAATNAA